MDDNSRGLIERGYKSLNEFHGRNIYGTVPQIEAPDIPIPENVIQISLEDLDYLRAIREESNKYPHVNVTDIRRIFPALDDQTIKGYFNILNKVDDETLFGNQIDTPGEIYKETISDVFKKGIRHVSKIPDQISDWYKRLRNIIPSRSTIYKSLELLKENFKENHPNAVPNAILSGKVLLGMALVALGTYGAKKIYDYVFKNDKTIEDKELGLPKPEIIKEEVPLAKIKPTEIPTSRKDPEEVVKEPIPAIKPIELKILEEIMEEPPKNVQIDHSLYIAQKIDRILRSKIKSNRQWEPCTYYHY